MSHKQYRQYVAVAVPGASDGAYAKSIVKELPIYLGDNSDDYRLVSHHELIEAIINREKIIGIVALHHQKQDKIEAMLRHNLHHYGDRHITYSLPPCEDFNSSDVPSAAEEIKQMIDGCHHAPPKSEVLMRNITQFNLALMRHAFFDQFESKIINEEQIVCRCMTRKFAERVAGKNVLIYHSPLERAVQTARIVRHELIDNNISVSKMEKLSQLEINKGNIHRAITMVNKQLQSDENFVLFIAHEPEILMFIGRCKGFDNCSIIARDFELVRPYH